MLPDQLLAISVNHLPTQERIRPGILRRSKKGLRFRHFNNFSIQEQCCALRQSPSLKNVVCDDYNGCAPFFIFSKNKRFDYFDINWIQVSRRLVKEKYLGNDYEQRVDDVFVYGWLTDSIGYFHFRSFREIEASTAAIDEIIAEFEGADAIVVDVRSNGGGNDRVGKLIADRFADRRRLYMVTSIRNGPDHDDFSPPRYWNVEPDGPIKFTEPVILLTHRHSISAAENFALAMRVLPNVTVLGETTSGVFADVYGDTLPNGWRFSVSYKLFVDYTGFCWEGLGVPPDIRQINSAEDIQQGRDRVLELAIDLLNTGALGLQDEEGSLESARQSLVQMLAKTIDESGIDAAIHEFNAAKMADPDTYYFDREEMELLAQRLLAADRLDDAIRLLEINAREFSDSWQVHDRLAEAYVRAVNSAAARASFQKALELNRRSYPWEVEAYEKAAKFLEEQAPGFVAPLERFVRQVMDAFDVPGVAVGVTQDGELVYTGAFGVKNIETGEPMRPDLVFHMASVSKPFVATAIMQLVERDALSLDTPVTDYLPYFKLNDDRYALVTIRQMLNHTSGMPDVEDYEWDRPQFDEKAAERYVRSLQDQAMIAAPGELFRYNHFVILPDEDLGLIVASNYSGAPMSALADGILDVLLGYEPTVPKPSRTR